MKKTESLKTVLARWDRDEIDFYAETSKHEPQRVRTLSDAGKGIWAPRPIRRIEQSEIRSFQKLYFALSALLCAGLIAALLYAVSYLPRYGSGNNPANNEVAQRYVEKGVEETGAVNTVSGMILDYRAFDTLGESHVLFTALMSVFILLRIDRRGSSAEEVDDDVFDLSGDVVLRLAVSALFPAILLFGFYIILNGHLSPGGGFAGGAVIGAGLILFSLTYGFSRTRKIITKKRFTAVTVSALMFYALSKGYSFFMGANGRATGIPLGTPGNILSAGLILPLNIAVGLVVACTMYGFYTIFRRGRL